MSNKIYLRPNILTKIHDMVFCFSSLSLSLSTLLQCLNKDWIINWLGLSDIQQCFRPPYLYTLIFTSDLMLKKKIFSGLYKRRVHNSRTAVVSVGDKAETLIRLLFYSRHHFVRNIQKHNAKKTNKRKASGTMNTFVIL